MESIELKKQAIRYWEKRRILWNLLVAIPSVGVYNMTIGEAPFTNTMETAMLALGGFVAAAVGANICYSFAYVVKFWVADSAIVKTYCETVRPVLFLLGCFLGIVLAVVGGYSIAVEQLAYLNQVPSP